MGPCRPRFGRCGRSGSRVPVARRGSHFRGAARRERQKRKPEAERVVWIVLLRLDGAGPLHRRLERALREAIRSGRVATGAVLPPSRELAQQLGCSRWAVTQAYSQLVSEGYLTSRVGAGTWVSWSGRTRRRARTAPFTTAETYRFDLAPGIPDLRAFPRTRWVEAARMALRSLPTAELGYPDDLGYLPLRELVADYLQRSRGAVAGAGDVVIRTGVSTSVAQLCTALRAMGVDRIAVENPGWSRLRAVIESTGMRAEPIPVDDDGLRTDHLGRPARPACRRRHRRTPVPDRCRALAAATAGADRLGPPEQRRDSRGRLRRGVSVRPRSGRHLAGDGAGARRTARIGEQDAESGGRHRLVRGPRPVAQAAGPVVRPRSIDSRPSDLCGTAPGRCVRPAPAGDAAPVQEPAGPDPHGRTT